ncbi:hypothetical protein ABDK00_006740 [Niabella insulamsoli]|uniref:hypothetical protein n=1 Tax=Niabella insulamsoli TaxID=3144874 RepID=UPI0031FCA541
MQQAGINIVAKWSADEVDAGIKAMVAKIESQKIDTSKLINPAALSKGFKPAADAMAVAQQQVKRLTREYQNLFLADKANTEQGHRVASALSARAQVAAQVLAVTRGIVNAAKNEYDAYGKLSQEANRLTRAYQNLAASGDATAEQLEASAIAAATANKRLYDIDSKVGRYQRNVGNYSSAFNGLQHSFNQITREMPAFANSMQTGFMAISNNIPMLVDEITNLKKRNVELRAEGKPTESVFKSLSGALFSWGTALSLGVTALTLYGPKLIEWVSDLGNGSDAAQKLKKDVEATNEALKDRSVIDARTNVMQLREEVDLARQGFLKKTDVVKHYNDTMGQATGEVKSLDGVETAIAQKADKYIQIMQLKAKATYAYAQAAQSAVRADQYISDYDTWDAIGEGVKTAWNNIKNFRLSVIPGTNGFLQGFKDLNKSTQDFNDIGDEAIRKAAQLSKEIGGNFFDNANPSKAGKSRIKALSDVYKEFNAEIDSIAGYVSAGIISPLDAANDRAQVLESTAKKLIGEFKQSPEKNSFLKGVLRDLTDVRLVIDLAGKEFKTAFFPRDTGLDIGAIDFKPAADLADKSLKWAQQVQKAAKDGIKYVFQDGIKVPLSVEVDPESLKNTYAAAQAMANAVNTTLVELANNAAYSIGDSFGKILTGQGGIGDLFNGLIKVLGEAFQSFGKKMIEIGIAMTSINNAVKFLQLNPALSIAAGIAAVALGSALKGSLNKDRSKTFAFADGGIVYGPTMGLVGEYPGASSNPEVIAPLNKLKDIIGKSETQVFIPETRIQGKDLVTVFKRSEQYNNR